MDISVIGGRRATLPPGWTRETTVSILGGAQIDVGDAPGRAARLTVVTVLGGVVVTVPDGARVRVGGFSLLGGRRIEVEPGATGDEIELRVYSLFGGLRVETRRRSSPPA